MNKEEKPNNLAKDLSWIIESSTDGATIDPMAVAALLRDAHQVVTDGKEPFFEYTRRFHQSDGARTAFKDLIMKFASQAEIHETENGNDPFEIKEAIFNGAMKFAREAFLIAVLLRTVNFASGVYENGFNISTCDAEMACHLRALLATEELPMPWD